MRGKELIDWEKLFSLHTSTKLFCTYLKDSHARFLIPICLFLFSIWSFENSDFSLTHRSFWIFWATFLLYYI